MRYGWLAAAVAMMFAGPASGVTVTFSDLPNGITPIERYTENGITVTSVGTIGGFEGDTGQLRFDLVAGFSTYDFMFTDGHRFIFNGLEISRGFSGARLDFIGYSSGDNVAVTGVIDASNSASTTVFTTPLSRLRLFASGGSVNIDNVMLNLPAVAPGVPEPASWAMMIAGMATIGATLRRRRPLPVHAG